MNMYYKSAIGFILGLLLLSIIWPYKPQLIDDSKEPDFKTLESDEIFFNNTRILHYRTIENEDLNTAGFRVHRISKSLKDTSFNYFNFAIINHWKEDCAYIVLEPSNSSFFADTISITIGDTLMRISINRMDYKDHYNVASEIFKRSLNHEIPYSISDNDSSFLFGTKANTKINEITLKDYFRLIGKFR